MPWGTVSRLIRDVTFSMFTSAPILSVLAQIPDVNLGNFLFAYGPLGLLLFWCITEGKKVLNRVSDKLDILAKTILIDLISRENVGPQARRMAQELLDETTSLPKR